MAKSLNRVTLLGRLGKDPELSYVPSGAAVCKFSMATSRSFKKGDEWKEETDWHNIVCWGKTAEAAGTYLTKGSQVYAEGRIQTRSYEDRDGNKKYVTEIIADSVIFLGGKQSGSQSDAAESTRQSAYSSSEITDDDIPF